MQSHSQLKFTNIEQLPIEMLLHIFSYLSEIDLNKFAQVNKSFLGKILGGEIHNNRSMANDLWKWKFHQHFPHRIKRVLEKDKDINWYVVFKAAYEAEYQHQINNKDGTVIYQPFDQRLKKLFSAVKDGDLKCIQGNQVTINDLYQEDRANNPLYFWAVTNHHQYLLDYFYQAIILPYYAPNCSPQKGDKNNRTLLTWAIRCNRPMEEINQLLDEGYGIEAKNENNLSPLCIAATNGHKDICEKLIQQGADVDAQTTAGLAPLHLVAQDDLKVAVELLLAHGANINATCNGGYTALHCAAQWGSLAALEILLAHGANIDVITSDGITPLHLAAQWDSLAALEILLAHGANINATCMHGGTALHYAALWGSLAVLETLLAHGANIDVVMSGGMTSLHLAAQKGHKAAVELLLAHGANIHAVTLIKGATPLHFAAFESHIAVLEILITHGANIHAVLNGTSITPLDSAKGQCLSYLKKVKEIKTKVNKLSPKQPIASQLVALLGHYFSPSVFSVDKLFTLFSPQPKEDIGKEIITALSKHQDWSLEECIVYLNEKLQGLTISSTDPWVILVKELERLERNSEAPTANKAFKNKG
jgi:ankyrin repeat protein